MNRPAPSDRAPPGGARPAPGSEEKLDRLRTLLREMFQLDRGDLDFGLYRIMRMRTDEIAAFLDGDLLPQVQDMLEGISAEDRAKLDKELGSTLEIVRKLGGINPDDTDLVKDLRRQQAEARADAEAEADVYNHLANFFARYYSEGDFMSQRRYSGGGGPAYLIPYDGEEVKLHWANADQYYVKTTENYASYVFAVGGGPSAEAQPYSSERTPAVSTTSVAGTADRPAGAGGAQAGWAGGQRVRFEIAKADNEKDNVKEAAGKQRRFLLAGTRPVTVEGGELIVRFEHRPLTEGEKKRFPGNGNRQQGRINAAAEERILNLKALEPDWRAPLAAPAPDRGNGERTVLAKHLERYTAKNTFDYFIHKDLGGFLRRELDLYLKSEVLNLDDLTRGDAARLRRALARVRTTRHVAEKIIAFLAQLEDFQKRLWLKKKFVLDTQYCVTLDRVPEALYPEIGANEAQREEWVELLAIDELAGDLGNGGAGYSEPLTIEFLKANPFLVLDTRHFDADFTDRLLAALSDAGPLDEQLDGLLVHGENFQALNLLRTRYGRQVSCIYIDPPYNTGDSEILYKNGYLSSSWLAMMADRLETTPELLMPDPVLFIAIDDFEMVNLAKLVDTEHPWLRREMIIVNHHPQGGKAKTLAHTHEYMLVCVPTSSDRTLTGRMSDDGIEHRPFRRSGTAESNFRRARLNSFYAILVDPDSRRVVELEPPPVGDEYPTGPTENGLARIYPIGGDGEERVWRRAYESCRELVEAGKLHCSNWNTIYQLVEAEERKAALFSNWVDPRYNAGTFGANLLADIIGTQNSFSYPKSVHTVADAIFAADLDMGACVLDFFAGSGTTAHAVVNLNRKDGRGRKYVLIEVADYFETVLLPRLKKVVHSADWKAGKPVSREGVSQLFKYIRIESYEDTMDGLEVAPQSREQIDMLAGNPELAEDYRLRYALGAETAGSSCLLGGLFTDPFVYTLSVVRDGVRIEAPADLPETFNYLLGLRVESRRRIDGVLAVTGTDTERRRCLILWRNLDETDHAALETWFANNRPRLPERLDLVYVNGDQTLNAIKQPGETWTAETIEPLFRELMFEDTRDDE